MARWKNWVENSCFLVASTAKYYELEVGYSQKYFGPTETLPFEWLHLIKWCIKIGIAEMPDFPLSLFFYSNLCEFAPL